VTVAAATGVESMVPSWMDVFGAALIVLALVGALAWLLRGGYTPFRRRAGASRLSVETALPLGDKRSLVVVAVEGRRLLLGLTPAGISLVTELQPAPPSFDKALEQAAGGERP